MGGVVAALAVLRRPEAVRRLVLAATSGGVSVAGLRQARWRDQYRRDFPGAAPWITGERVGDLSARLAELRVPTLLLWSDADEISPLAVGQRLAGLLPRATLVVIAGGDHMFARDRAAEVAPYVARHLFSGSVA
jgi:pimeloyl-ACP methyl ester carboxylesterase